MPNTLCTKYFDGGRATIWLLPLIALHEQHHHTSRRFGITSESWTFNTSSSNPPGNILVTIDQTSYDSFKRFVSQLIDKDLLARINIDEAHLILTHSSFRPVMQLLRWIASSPIQIVITTATLPPSLEPLLLSYVGITSSLTTRAPTPRSNISFKVVRIEHEPFERGVEEEFSNALTYSRTNRVILFCLSRREVERYAKTLRVPYCHAGVDIEEIRTILDRFRNDDECRGLVASSILGVGLDVPNVSHVLHANLPRDALSFIQEAGRAGRGEVHQPAFSIVILPPSLPLPTYPSPDLFGAQILRDSLLDQTLCRRVALQKFLDGTAETCTMISSSTHLIILLPEYGLYSTLQDFNYIEDV
jgi:superfamily II DNA helicase RecQ